MKMGGHIPVLLKEVMDALAVRPGGRYVDGTLGRAGHTKEIIARGGMVLGIDRDEQAIREIGEVAGLTAVRGRHGDLREIANERGWVEVDGILLDLGVSSPQLDEAGRGFSFLREGPLDMRMDRSSGLSAADIVNGESAERLEEIFREWGEEPQARRIAKAIVKERENKKFETTVELADFVERVVGRRGAHHPATRVFQALRMEVNDEMGELERALEGGLELLKSGGRFAVITFESLTDRIVKRFFARHVGRMVSLQQGGERWEGEEPKMRAVTGKVVVASEEEADLNPRSRSAKLRAAEKE
ncbi:MAG: 16S rRNA (cytosine(1402)-N(4))-methyltransferase RsmH [Kiritimatiellae bacterium]|nr:16S rRNA (cytosine(1402)-N(4))-methyltransferase RsmH [Kiritimatiellia bacterium]